jgi:hypothetical protein
VTSMSLRDESLGALSPHYFSDENPESAESRSDGGAVLSI